MLFWKKKVPYYTNINYQCTKQSRIINYSFLLQLWLMIMSFYKCRQCAWSRPAVLWVITGNKLNDEDAFGWLNLMQTMCHNTYRTQWRNFLCNYLNPLVSFKALKRVLSVWMALWHFLFNCRRASPEWLTLDDKHLCYSLRYFGCLLWLQRWSEGKDKQVRVGKA